ncbi:MAG: acetate--CoA ligase [Dehalococcoidia bacterium]|nr:acetate--CoA ligase [Dehalococcoidia bacterium]
MSPVTPNLGDYEQTAAAFDWDTARGWLDGLPGGGLNIAHEAVDRHAAGARADHVAIRWRGRRGERRDISYGELGRLSNQFANVLASLGVAPGDRVFSLCPRVPELYVAALGTLKQRAVYCPLFPAFGPEPIRERLQRGGGVVLVTTESLYRRRVAPIRDQLPELRHVLVIAEPDQAPAGTLDFRASLAGASEEFAIGPTAPEDPALLHFTSGTTGRPKGAIHVHEAVVAHHATARFALDLHPEDVFWCTADPGWVTGTSYGIIAPLTHGVTSIVEEAEFDAAGWYQLLQDEGVTVWYTAPTAIRLLMRAGADLARQYDLGRLRLVASVGEPLAPDAVAWAQETWGKPVLDNWWQTETGGIMISNYVAMPVRPGSMGRPVPGIEAALVERSEDGHVRPIEDAGEPGEIALRAGWPSMFRGYFGDPERYARCFADGWYLTGDLATKDADGYFWFVGRADDVIKSAGHLIGPFEVESALTEHAAVAEAAVIGLPDPILGDAVAAFVVLRAGFERSEDLERDLLAHARQRLGAQVAPRSVRFVEDLPHTRSGKVMRRLLRARELGLPEGDLSTLERAEQGSEGAP